MTGWLFFQLALPQKKEITIEMIRFVICVVRIRIQGDDSLKGNVNNHNRHFSFIISVQQALPAIIKSLEIPLVCGLKHVQVVVEVASPAEID